MAGVYIGIILCMRVVQSVFSKYAATSIPQTKEGYVRHLAYRQAAAFVMAASLLLIELLWGGSPVACVGETVLYAAVSGASLAISGLCGLYAISHGTLVLSSLFGTAGLLVPTIASAILYDERLRLHRVIAVMGLLLSVWLLIGGGKKRTERITRKTLAALCLVMLGEGGTMLCQKMFGMNVQGGNVSLFSAIQFLAAAGIALLSLPFLRIGRADGDRIEKLPPQSYLYGLLLAVAVFVISQLATQCVSLVPAVILFACINGGATLISAMVGALMFREKLTVRSTFGLVLGVAALIAMKG